MCLVLPNWLEMDIVLTSMLRYACCVQSLEGAKKVHAFVRDADDAIEWIQEKEIPVQSEDFGHDLQSVQALIEKHQGFEVSAFVLRCFQILRSRVSRGWFWFKIHSKTWLPSVAGWSPLPKWQKCCWSSFQMHRSTFIPSMKRWSPHGTRSLSKLRSGRPDSAVLSIYRCTSMTTENYCELFSV